MKLRVHTTISRGDFNLPLDAIIHRITRTNTGGYSIVWYEWIVGEDE